MSSKSILPSLTGEHGCESEKYGHGNGKSLRYAGRGQEERQPGDGEEDGGDHVGLDQVVPQLPPQLHLQYQTRVVEIIVGSVIRLLIGQLLLVTSRLFSIFNKLSKKHYKRQFKSHKTVPPRKS